MYRCDSRAGKLTAIVGESGSGKTSIASLLQRVYEPQSGRLTIQGVDLRNVNLRCLRRSIGVVPQRVQLFAGSLTDNITVGDPAPDPMRVHALCSELGIDRIAARLPDGLCAQIAEDGGNLSGGERQRIAIARALYHEPAILVFDEATAALDAASAHVVQRCVRRLRDEGKTIVVITHHLMSIADADQIIVMERGRVIEHGTHCELIERRGALRAAVGPADLGDRCFGRSGPVSMMHTLQRHDRHQHLVLGRLRGVRPRDARARPRRVSSQAA